MIQTNMGNLCRTLLRKNVKGIPNYNFKIGMAMNDNDDARVSKAKKILKDNKNRRC